MYKNKHKKIIAGIFTLSLVLSTNISCGRGTVVKPSPQPNTTKIINTYFNNDYKGLVSYNEIIIKKDENAPYKKLTDAVNIAKESVDFCIYDIQDLDITKVITDAKKRGLKVRVVTDTDSLTNGKTGPVRDSIKQIKDSGIEIKDDKRSALMHNKFVIIDSKYVWTGSMNFTSNSLYDHNNDSLLIDSKELAANYQAEFNRYFEKGMFAANSHEIPNPKITLTNSDTIETFFSPEGGTTAAILKELKAAKKSIKFMAFAFTNKDMANEILIKNKQKVACEGIYDSCEISKYSTYDTLKQNKITVYKDGNQALMHEKTFIIDDNVVITGSFNFTNSAEHNNNENTLIIHSKDVAATFNEEYNRLKTAAMNNKNLPPYDHPACKGGTNNPNDDGDE